ncbi:MAG: ribose-5-phosphate isomerase RpiA [Polyangiaceae bacterium]|jgi:ribose 5-phosphate isomerase A
MENAKLNAARAAIRELPEHGTIGLGSGTTARLFVEELAKLVRAGRRYVGVPTSQATQALAVSLGIPLLDAVGPWVIDINVDGADEVSEAFDLIKGGGSAHAREKIVNASARRNVVIVDLRKMSTRLGEKFCVPIEVLQFGHGATAYHLAQFGHPSLRLAGGAPVQTDGGNYIYDLRVGPIDNPQTLDAALSIIPGVVETGLFVGRADIILVGDETGVRRLVNPRSPS